MNRRFYNYICTVYTFGQVTVRGSVVQGKVVKYANIRCALWKNTKSYNESPLAVQTESNSFELNLSAVNPVNVGDIISTKIGEFKVDQVVEHHNSRGKLDNFQVFVSQTT